MTDIGNLAWKYFQESFIYFVDKHAPFARSGPGSIRNWLASYMRESRPGQLRENPDPMMIGYVFVSCVISLQFTASTGSILSDFNH